MLQQEQASPQGRRQADRPSSVRNALYGDDNVLCSAHGVQNDSSGASPPPNAGVVSIELPHEPMLRPSTLVKHSEARAIPLSTANTLWQQ